MNTFTDRERFQPRLLFTRHAGFRFADVKDHIRPFHALHCRIDNLADTPNVFVVDSVALSLAHLLENHLLRQLCGNASENAFGDLRNLQLSANFQVGIDLARIFQCDLQVRIFHLLGSLHHSLYRKGMNLARFLVQLRAQILLRLVVLARSHNNGVFHRANYNLRINAFFPAQRVDSVVELTCHKSLLSGH